MKLLLAVLLFVTGAAVTAFVTIGVLIVPGIEGIINGATADPVNSSKIAWGCVKAFILPEIAAIGIMGLTLILGIWLGFRNELRAMMPQIIKDFMY